MEPRHKVWCRITSFVRKTHLIMAALRSKCGHYMLVLPCGFFYISFFFSSPNFSRRRLDVSIHGVALARISDAGLKRAVAVRGSLKYRTQKIAKNSPSGHHRTQLSGYIFAIKAHIDNREKTY